MVRHRHITAFPTLSLRVLFRRSAALARAGATGDTVVLLSSARAAAFHAVRHFGIRAPDRVLVPSYHCGVEIEAILQAGAAVTYYSVGRGMSVDDATLLQNMAPEVKALFVVHYWGFPQDARNLAGLCKQHGILLIEDCAHALFSGDGSGPVGVSGDAALFSLPKTLPLPDGGILRLKGKVPGPQDLRGGINAAAYKVGIRSVLEHQRSASRAPLSSFAGLLLDGMHRAAATSDTGWVDHGETPLCMYRRGMSCLSRFVFRRALEGEVVARRRANYAALLARLADEGDLDVVHDRLGEGVCPLFLPVIAPDRDGLEGHLRRRGIGTFVFGRDLHRTLDRDEYPDATYLSRHVLGLPIHQDLDEKDMEFIAEAIKERPGD